MLVRKLMRRGVRRPGIQIHLMTDLNIGRATPRVEAACQTNLSCGDMVGGSLMSISDLKHEIFSLPVQVRLRGGRGAQRERRTRREKRQAPTSTRGPLSWNQTTI
jgi:hypothetical protein